MIAVTTMVWAIPRSLATTCGITIVFFSSGYLDVSVHRVRLPVCNDRNIPNCFGMGCPIGKSPAQRLFAPNRSLSQLITSFIASESQGIHHLLLLTFLLYYLLFFYPICCCRVFFPIMSKSVKTGLWYHKTRYHKEMTRSRLR